MPEDKDQAQDLRIAHSSERIGQLEAIIGLNGNGIMKQINNLVIDQKATERMVSDIQRTIESHATKKELSNTEMRIINRINDMNSQKKQDGQYRIDTVISSISSISTFGVLLYYILARGL